MHLSARTEIQSGQRRHYFFLPVEEVAPSPHLWPHGADLLQRRWNTGTSESVLGSAGDWSPLVTTSQHFRQCAWVRRVVPVGRTQAQFMWPRAGLGLAVGLLNHSQLLKQREQNVPLLPAWFNTITWARRCWMLPFGFGPAVLRRCNKHT